MTDDWILTLNAGASSLKFAAYARHSDHQITSGQIAAIGPGARLHTDVGDITVAARNHTEAVQAALQFLDNQPLLNPLPSIVGHRIVHGGNLLATAEITPEIRQEIEAAATLAPLHNPPALSMIDAVHTLTNDVRQVACFDTTFHADNPSEATTLPIPKDLREKGIRRYGFHGLSYASLVRRFSSVTGTLLPKRVLAFHLGAGASLAAIVEGKGVATTMGFSPMDGLVMATRAGAMDAGVILHLIRSEGMGADQIDHLLNRESGLQALSGGNSDMKSLLASDDSAAKFAVSHYCYWASRHAGSMIAAMGGVDGLIFTGGIGEKAVPIRKKILNHLSWAGELPHWVIPADEEGEIAYDARLALSATP
ncbi:MAG: acetate kinase [Paracoccaceae bacterium]